MATKKQAQARKSKTRIDRYRGPGKDGGGSASFGFEDSPAVTFDSPPPIISSNQVQNILSYYFSALIPPNEFAIRTIIADGSYITVPPGWVRNCIVADPILAPENYVNDVFDCDDYVQYLKTKVSLYAASKKFPAPIAVGYLFTKIHAFSFCIDPSSQLYLINTQSTTRPVNGDRDLFPQFLAFHPNDNPLTAIYI
jgi:hypothetical protein